MLTLFLLPIKREVLGVLKKHNSQLRGATEEHTADRVDGPHHGQGAPYKTEINHISKAYNRGISIKQQLRTGVRSRSCLSVLRVGRRPPLVGRGVS